MSPLRRDAAAEEALSRYRAALLAGVATDELARLAEGLDPGLVATERWSLTTGRRNRRQPDPYFVRQLRHDLVQAASGAAAPEAAPATPPTPFDLQRAAAPRSPVVQEGPPPPPLLRPRWGWGQLAAAAVLAIFIVTGLLLVRYVFVGRPVTQLVAPGAPTTETLVDATLQGAPDSWTPLTIERWRFQAGATLSIPALDGPQWIVADSGPIVATIDGQGKLLALGRDLIVPARQTLELRNSELTEVAVLRGVATTGFALEEYDRNLVHKEVALDTAAHEALPPGASHIIFDRLIIPPGTTMMAEAATGQDWFSVTTGQLGLTLIGDALPAGWQSGQERELAPAETIPLLVPGTRITMHNLGDDPLVLLRLRVTPQPAQGSPAAATSAAG